MARRNAEQTGVENCSFFVSAIEEFAYDETFDCVVATDVLEHIEDDATAFEKLVHLVKPDGIILITVPAGQWLFGFHDEARVISVAIRGAGCAASSPVGAVSERCAYFGFSLIPVCYLYSKLLRKPYPVGESGDSKKNPVVSLTLRSMLGVDRLLLDAVRHEPDPESDAAPRDSSFRTTKTKRKTTNHTNHTNEEKKGELLPLLSFVLFVLFVVLRLFLRESQVPRRLP